MEDDDNMNYSRIGFKGLSAFINWLEKKYTLKEK